MSVAVVAVLLGCGEPAGETAPVSGVVTYKGAPVEGATVAFHPRMGQMATGKTDASGKFTLSTYNPSDGAPPGQCTVTISKKSVTGATTGSSSMEEAAAKSGQPTPTETNALPEIYANPATTPLKETVSKDKKNEFTFELTD